MLPCLDVDCGHHVPETTSAKKRKVLINLAEFEARTVPPYYLKNEGFNVFT
jgi:hypothetical protein